MIDCGFAKCVTSGDGFEEGFTYPILGTNNGIHIMREKWAGRINDPGGDSSDPYDFIACTGGVGDGLFNNFDGSGKPSFIHADVVEVVRCKDCIHYVDYVNRRNSGACGVLGSAYVTVKEDDYCSMGERNDD